MSEIKFKLCTPTVPNFIFIDMGQVGKRQDGYREKPKVSLAELSEEQIDQVAENYRLALHERANQKRKAPTDR